ncbi:MAG: hypothetical protein K2M70_10810 [Lachnospiraceae bacterium]|nr:hypothetical protein [Lachnospiraceae bacterium]
MLTVLFSWMIIGGASLLFGKAITDSVYKDRLEEMGRPDIYIMTGVIFLNVFAQFFSLFYKVAGIACAILGLAGIVIAAVWAYSGIRHKKRWTLFPGCERKRPELWRIAALLLALVFTLLWTTQSPGQYDTGLYHAQAVRWIEDYGVVPGLGNLHMRLAYNSAFMSLQALFSLGWLLGQSLHTLNGFLCLMALGYALSTVRLWGRESCRVSDLLKCVMVIYVVQKRYDISSSGTDILAMLLILYLFIKWSEYRERGREDGVLYGYLCLVSVYAVTVKLSAASAVVLALYPLYLFLKNKNVRAVFAHVAAGLLILLPFLIRNVIISGYLVYPYGGLDLFQVDWKMDKAVLTRDSLDIKMYARGIRNPAEYDTSLAGWIPRWFLSQSAGNRIVLVVGLFCIPAALYLLWKSFREKRYAQGALLGASLVNLIFWLAAAPHIRYGGPYIYVLAAVTLGTAEFAYRDRILPVAAVIVLLPYLVSYGVKAVETPEILAEYSIRQPDYLSWQSTQYPVGNQHIWKPDEGDLSGYFAFPATPQGNQLKVLELRGESFREGFRHE